VIGNLKNLAITTVASAPSPAASGTSLGVATGEGTRLPPTPFQLTISPTPSASNPYATPANSEIATCTDRSGDTLTLLRAQEGTTARTVTVGDLIVASVTADVLEGLASSTSRRITQASHGLAVGDVVRLSGTSYVKAQADTEANAEVVGIVGTVIDTSTFVLVTDGRAAGLSGLTAGTVYYLSAATAGALTTTEPTTAGHVSKPVLIADSTTSGLFVNMRGFKVGGAAGAGAGGLGGTLALYVLTR
jgi:hypothetical protein